MILLYTLKPWRHTQVVVIMKDNHDRGLPVMAIFCEDNLADLKTYRLDPYQARISCS